MKQSIAFLILLFFAALPSSAAPPAGYTLEWEDNFDGLTLDETKWSHRLLGPRRDAVNVVEAVTLTGEGTLKITTSKVGDEYHTGMIGTQGKFERAFGYWEARIKLQDQEGHWSAFWVQSPTIGNPIGDTLVAGTEIDVVEYHSNWGDGLQNTLHWDGYGTDHKSAAKSATIAGLKDGFHTFAVLWTPNEYVFYTDGIETWRTSTALSHRTQYAILSLEVESWAGNIANAVLPDSMEVDYVRWYAPPVAPPPPPPGVIEDPAIVAGPGDIIDPPGSETVDQSFGTPQETLEARSDLRVLQDFTYFTASTTGDNMVRFIDSTLPDMQFQFTGAFNTNSAGAEGNNILFATSGSSHLTQRNSAAGTSTLTITFGTWDGTAFTGNQSIGAAGFTLSHVYTGKSGIVTFRDSAGTAITGATFSYSGLSDVDSSGNHRDIYFGWDSTAQSTVPIGSITITFTDSGSPYASGLDDFAFTTVTPRLYDSWASTNAPGSAVGDDFDGDGVLNAIEFVLGGDKDTNDRGKLPVVATPGTDMTFSFVRDQASIDPGVSVVIAVGTDLATWPWPLAYSVDADTANSSEGVTVTDNGDGTDAITLTIPREPDAKKFARLVVIFSR